VKREKGQKGCNASPFINFAEQVKEI
jgi:hypothetical protein